MSYNRSKRGSPAKLHHIDVADIRLYLGGFPLHVLLDGNSLQSLNSEIAFLTIRFDPSPEFSGLFGLSTALVSREPVPTATDDNRHLDCCFINQFHHRRCRHFGEFYPIGILRNSDDEPVAIMQFAIILVKIIKSKENTRVFRRGRVSKTALGNVLASSP